MSKSAIKSLSLRGDNLIVMIHEFNTLPAHYTHASWMENVLPALQFEKLKQSSRARKILSQRILKDINHLYIYDFEPISRRMALLQVQRLEKLMLFTGIALISNKIAKIITRQQLLEVKQSLGKDMYDFAIKKAPLLMEDVQFDFGEDQRNPDLRSFALSCGTKCFEMCLSFEPEALIRRLQLKFPRQRQWNFFHKVSAKEKDQAWLIIKRVLLQEVAPEWKPIFS